MNPALMLLLRGAAASVPLSVSYLTNAISATDASSYTFSGLSLGTASASRVIFVAVAHRKADPSASTSSVTIGGVSATLVTSSTASNAGSVVEFWRAAVPTGTTGDVVVTTSATVLRCGVGLWRVDGLTSASGGAVAGSTTITPPAGTMTIAASSTAVPGPISTAWSGLTEVWDVPSGESLNWSGANGVRPSSVTATPSSIAAQCLSVVSLT